MIRRIGFFVLLLSIQTVHAWQIDYNNNNLYPSIRDINTVYYNNNSYPIYVIISIEYYQLRDDGATSVFFINTTNIAQSGYVSPLIYDTTNSLDSYYSYQILVPQNTNYSINTYTGVSSYADIMYWYEWEVKEDTMLVENTTIIAVGIIFIVIYILYKEIVR